MNRRLGAWLLAALHLAGSAAVLFLIYPGVGLPDRLVYTATCLLYGFMAVVSFHARGNDRGVQVFTVFATFVVVTFVVFPYIPYSSPALANPLWAVVFNGIFMTMAALILHVCGYLPTQDPGHRSLPGLVRTTYAVAAALTVLATYLEWMAGASAQRTVRLIVLAFYSTAALGGSALVVYQSRRTRSLEARRQALAVCFALVPYGVCRAASALFPWLSTLQSYGALDSLVILLLPVAFFVAIHGFHLFEIRVYARRGLVLSLTLALLGGSAAVIIMVLGTLLPALATAWGFTVTCLLAGLLLRPAVRHLTALGDTLFFPERVAVQKLTHEILPQVASHTDVRALARALSTTVVDSLGLSCAALFVANEEGSAFHMVGSAGPRPVDARTVAAPSWEPHEVRQFEAVIAIRFRERVNGLLGLGGKTAGDPIAPEEIKELELATLQVAAMIENARLFALATRDSLTGLYRRVVFEERLGIEVSRFARGGRPCAVVMIDIDHFKKVNDTWGHQRGDDVLAAVADAISRGCRDIDTVARYGGEEIAVLLPDADEAAAAAVGEKLRAAVEALAPPRVPAPVTISVGVAALSAGMPSQELVRQADEALYRAKHAGRNRVEAARLFPRLATSS